MNDIRDDFGKFAPHPVAYRDIVKQCKYCGNTLTLHNNRDILRKNYCSSSCRSKGSARTEAFRANATKTCAYCDTDFIAKTLRQKYCSSECCAQAVMKAYRKRRSSTVEGYFRVLLRVNTKRSGIAISHLIELLEKQGGRCAVSGVEMTRISGNGHVATNISIDRIDSSKGYTPDNIQLVCHIVNLMKHNLSTSQLVNWCRKIVERAGG